MNFYNTSAKMSCVCVLRTLFEFCVLRYVRRNTMLGVVEMLDATEKVKSAQGSSAGCIYVGSGDPVRVLRLSHNEYAGYTLKHLLLRHMYNLPLPKLPATLLVAGTQLFSAVVTQ